MDASLELSVQRFPDAPGVLTQVVDVARAHTELAVHGRASTTLVLQVRDRSGRPLGVKLPEGSQAQGFWVGGTRVNPPTNQCFRAVVITWTPRRPPR